MSLAVWLPLNGNLENQGYSTIQVTNNGATIDNNGKIGKCYSFTNNNIVIPSTNFKNNFTNNQASLTAWIKVSTNHNAYAQALTLGTQGTSWNNILFGIDINGSGNPIANASTGSAYTNLSFNTAIKDETWHHLAYTYDNGKMTVYLDGIQKATGNTSNTPAWANSTNLYIGGNSGGEKFVNGDLMNDVRLYDHCLSPLEVKEIAQGLVLHYKLDGNGMGNPNLLANSKLDGSWTYPSSSYSDKYHPITTSIPSTSQYTLSFEAKSTVNGDIIRTHYYNPNTTTTCVSSQGSSRTESDGYMTFSLTTEWKKYWVVYSQSETTAVKTVICPRLVSGEGTGTISLKNVKLEEGSTATPWCPNETDELYQIMGQHDVVLDSSGYNNNGTVVGTLTTSSDTARYECSTVFNNGEIYNSSTIIQNQNCFTLSAWVKLNAYASERSMIILMNQFYLTINSSGQISGYAYGKNPAGYHNSSTSVPLNKWTHIAITWDDNTIKFYINGILDKNISCTGTSNSNNYGLHIGQENSGRVTNGSISDVRAYCTALSATDIQLLYSAGARADNLGGLHVQEFEESARKGVTTQRILHSSNLYESGYQEILHYDKNVYTESDGTTWVRIFHHNNPANALFSSTDTFETSVYKDVDRWYDIEPLMSNMPMYEFMVKQKTTSSATETKYRWIQNINPLEATWTNVQPSSITRITTSGYTDGTFGGLYKNTRNNAKLTIANNSSNDWWGALGSWTAYSGGIPGYPTNVITTGYIDLYIRIYIPIKFIKNTGTNALNFIEI